MAGAAADAAVRADGQISIGGAASTTRDLDYQIATTVWRWPSRHLDLNDALAARERVGSGYDEGRAQERRLAHGHASGAC